MFSKGGPPLFEIQSSLGCVATGKKGSSLFLSAEDADPPTLVLFSCRDVRLPLLRTDQSFNQTFEISAMSLSCRIELTRCSIYMVAYCMFVTRLTAAGACATFTLHLWRRLKVQG